MDKNKIRIDDWVHQTLSQESDNEGIHQAWDKMSALLDDEKSNKPKAAFWWGKGGFSVLLIAALLASGTGIALWKSNDTIVNTIEGTSSHQLSNWKNVFGSHSLTQQAVVATPMSQSSVASDNNLSQTQLHDNIIKNNAQTQQQFSQVTHNNTSTPSHIPSSQSDKKNLKNNKDQILINEDIGKGNAAEGMIASTNKSIPHDIKKQHNIDSLKKVIEDDIINKKIAYSEKTKTIGRVNKIKVNETHEVIDYPGAKDNNNKPIVRQVETKTYTKVDLIPLSRVEEMILNSYTYEWLESEKSEEKLRYLKIIQKDMSASFASESKAQSNKSTSKENIKSLLKDINNYFNLRNNFYGTAHLGFNSTPGNWAPLGFQGGLGMNYYISQRFTLGLEGIYNFRNLDLTILDQHNEYTVIKSGHTGLVPYFDYTDKSIDREYKIQNIQAFHFPLMLTYHTSKMSIGLGPVVTFTNGIKHISTEKTNEVERRIIADTTEAFPLANKPFGYSNSDFGKNMLLGINAGVNFNINQQVGVNLRYSQLFWDNGKTTSTHDIMRETFKKPEIRIGIQYKLNKTKRVQYMMPTNSK